MITKFKIFEQHENIDPYNEEDWINDNIDQTENSYVNDFYWHLPMSPNDERGLAYLDLHLINYDKDFKKRLIMAMHKTFNYYNIKEIQDILNNCPLVLIENVDRVEGERIKEILETNGAIVEIRPRYIN